MHKRLLQNIKFVVLLWSETVQWPLLIIKNVEFQVVYFSFAHKVFIIIALCVIYLCNLFQYKTTFVYRIFPLTTVVFIFEKMQLLFESHKYVSAKYSYSRGNRTAGVTGTLNDLSQFSIIAHQVYFCYFSVNNIIIFRRLKYALLFIMRCYQ